MKKTNTVVLSLLTCFALSAYENYDGAFQEAQRLGKENKTKEALTVYRKAVELSQADWQKYKALYCVAELQFKTRDFPEAEKSIAALNALKLDATQSASVCNLNTEILVAQKKMNEAAAELKKILAMTGDSLNPYYFYVGATQSLELLKDRKLAAEFIQRVHASKQTKPEWMMNRIKAMSVKISEAK